MMMTARYNLSATAGQINVPVSTEPVCCPTPRRKTVKKDRVVKPCLGNREVQVFCAFGCGTSYTTLPRDLDSVQWGKTLRKLNAHESQRCRCNPSATRVGCKASRRRSGKSKATTAASATLRQWEQVLLQNHVKTLEQQIQFLQHLRGSSDVSDQVALLQGSIAQTNSFIATIKEDESVRHEAQIQADLTSAMERTRILEETQVRYTASPESDVGRYWTEPTFLSQQEWQHDKELVGGMEEEERHLRVTDPATPYDEAVGVFWTAAPDVPTLAANEARVALTRGLEETERARRLRENCLSAMHRTRARLVAVWPEFSRALTCRRRPVVHAAPKLATPPARAIRAPQQSLCSRAKCLSAKRGRSTSTCPSPVASVATKSRKCDGEKLAAPSVLNQLDDIIGLFDGENLFDGEILSSAGGLDFDLGASPSEKAFNNSARRDNASPRLFSENDELLVALDELLDLDADPSAAQELDCFGISGIIPGLCV